ncbi:gamma-glutamyl-gamma-aminobutyrate hydrolase [Plantactinospora sp. KBS50]|nr:gamma-glutamyl-gamma-aminobutyrate hydrolase family protein [Plantactinospora sp. KBS50]ASW57508.1 gamma-glutamyl-gamma-aminobutyrate hydrolase [Plantactinospora sp. KBS50]
MIGITTYVAPASFRGWTDVRTAVLPHSYVAMVRAAGGHAVLLPSDDAGTAVLAALDGIVFAGGEDVDPARYGQPAGPHVDCVPERDAGELALLAGALAVDLPVLGVCRGMQLLVIGYGGGLHQHLPDVLGHHRHRPAPGTYGRHGVRFAPGSAVAALMAGSAEVNTYHHQGVADPGGLRATGWADDGLIEAVEDPDRRFVLGVQWHPETDGDVRPFAALVRAAGGGAGGSRPAAGYLPDPAG